MKKQVCSIIHEANARQKGEFFLRKARAVFHPVTNFILKGFNERTLPKEVEKSLRAFFAETALIIRFDSNFKKETVHCHFSMQRSGKMAAYFRSFVELNG